MKKSGVAEWQTLKATKIGCGESVRLNIGRSNINQDGSTHAGSIPAPGTKSAHVKTRWPRWWLSARCERFHPTEAGDSGKDCKMERRFGPKVGRKDRVGFKRFEGFSEL